jgi:hypothetical protein
MTSPRKIKANRANAQASTGPRTAPGRARAARNARRHGLSLSVFADPTLSEQVEMLAREIAGEVSNDRIYQLARRVAEAQVDLQRVRCARHQLTSEHIANPNYYPGAYRRKLLSLLLRVRGSLRKVHLDSAPFQGARKLAAIPLDESERLRAMDRYERRALSRRKFAIRALDHARREAITDK